MGDQVSRHLLPPPPPASSPLSAPPPLFLLLLRRSSTSILTSCSSPPPAAHVVTPPPAAAAFICTAPSGCARASRPPALCAAPSSPPVRCFSSWLLTICATSRREPTASSTSAGWRSARGELISAGGRYTTTIYDGHTWLKGARASPCVGIDRGAGGTGSRAHRICAADGRGVEWRTCRVRLSAAQARLPRGTCQPSN